MRSTACVSALLLSLTLAPPLFAQTEPAKVYGLVELSGTGATSGTNFNDGVKLAVKEINAGGGILGRKVEYTTNDTQSQPQVAKALAVKAIDDGAYVVMGPVFSGSILVSMVETKRAEIPNFTGGEAAAITQQGNPYIFRTSFTQTTAMPKVARYLKDELKAKSVAMIWVNNDFGKGGRDTFIKAIEAQGIKLAADISTDPGQLLARLLSLIPSGTIKGFIVSLPHTNFRSTRPARSSSHCSRGGSCVFWFSRREAVA